MSNIKVFILRGLPGAGKSTYIKNKSAEIAVAYPGIERIVVSADHHFLFCAHTIGYEAPVNSGAWAKVALKKVQNQHKAACPNALYNFYPEQLGQAHGDCQDIFMSLLDADEPAFIFVDNTNLSKRDMEFYVKACAAHLVEYVIVNVRCDKEIAAQRGIHQVPIDKYPQLQAKMRHGDEELAKLDWPQVEYYT